MPSILNPYSQARGPASGAAFGDVIGPASSTNERVARWDGATGKLLQDSAVTIADTTGAMTLVGDAGQPIDFLVITGNGITFAWDQSAAKVTLNQHLELTSKSLYAGLYCHATEYKPGGLTDMIFKLRSAHTFLWKDSSDVTQMTFDPATATITLKGAVSDPTIFPQDYSGIQYLEFGSRIYVPAAESSFHSIATPQVRSNNSSVPFKFQQNGAQPFEFLDYATNVLGRIDSTGNLSLLGMIRCCAYLEGGSMTKDINAADLWIVLSDDLTELGTGKNTTYADGSALSGVGDIDEVSYVGSSVRATTTSAHGLAVDDIVSVVGTTNYDGTYVVTAVDTNWFEFAGSDNGTESATYDWYKAFTILAAKAGHVEVRWSMSIAANTADDVIAIAVFKGATKVTGSEIRSQLDKSPDHMSGCCIVEVAADDKLSLAVQNTTAARDITISYLNWTVMSYAQDV